MADYYPLLARALESLPDKSPAARSVVYDRAKTALLGQLKTVTPPLGEEAIQREIDSLEEAIARIEKAQEPPVAAAPVETDAPSPVARPKVDGTQIRRGGRRNRSLLTALGLVAVIVPIAVVAWLWRDRPAEQQQAAAPPAASAPTAQPAPSGSDPKFPERVGGGNAQPSGPGPASAPSGPASSPAQPSQAEQRPTQAAPPTDAVAVAQKAALIEENTQDPQQPKMTSGRAFWRIDAMNSGQGQPLETVVRANVEVPEAGLSLQLTMKRNRDSALPASHTMELVFTTPAGDPARAVRDVNPPLFRGDDGSRGVPVAALSVPVKENLFLVGLSDLRGDVERNTDLVRNRNWIEVPLRFASGQRATLVFEKGVTGDRIIQDAFKAWAQP